MLRNEIIGIVGTVILVASMMISARSPLSRIVLRSLNAAASIFFIIYAVLTSTFSTGLSNSIILIVDIFYVIKEIHINGGNK